MIPKPEVLDEDPVDDDVVEVTVGDGVIRDQEFSDTGGFIKNICYVLQTFICNTDYVLRHRVEELFSTFWQWAVNICNRETENIRNWELKECLDALKKTEVVMVIKLE